MNLKVNENEALERYRCEQCNLDFALLDEHGVHLESLQVSNGRTAVMTLMNSWKKRYGVDTGECLVCLEPTGHYTLMLLNLIVEQHWHAWLAHPLDIQKSMGIKRVKNDKVDALRSRNTHAHFERKHVCSQHRTSSSINSSTCST
ncbi:MAG: transposase [Flavobacteriales bacterium]|nr:transposase [Flavobacteriales bacterium]